MTVDPHIDYESHDPDDEEELSENPDIRAAQEYEARIRKVLATKDNPLSDGDSTAARMRKLDQEERQSATTR
jgi:hypothetical protein